MRRAEIIQLLFLTLFLTIGNLCNAQFQQNKFESLQVENGLPSDFIYKCWQDHQGFLWISTDAGLARYDGKNFQIFRAQDGLPDNDIENLIQEKNGTIWVQSFSGQLAYYDHLRRRFIKPKASNPLGKIKGIYDLTRLTSGGIMIQAFNGTYTFINNTLQNYALHKATDSARLFKLNMDGSELRYRLVEQVNRNNKLIIYQIKNNKLISQQEVPTSANIVSFNSFDSSLYLFERKSTSMSRISEFAYSPLGFKVTNKSLPHPYNRHNFTNKFVNVYHRYNKNNISVIAISVHDIHSLEFLFPIDIDAVAWHMINDKNNNLWVSTHSGLLCYKRREKIQPYLREYHDTAIYSIAHMSNGSLLFGSSNGQVIQKSDHKTTVHKIKSKADIEWQRNIIISQNKLFSFADGGIFVNYAKEIQFNGNSLSTSAVLPINDSIILLANKEKLYKLNTRSEKIESFFDVNINISSLASIDSILLYIGTNEGIRMLNLLTRQLKKIDDHQQLLNENISALCITKDSIIWVGLAIKGIVAIKNFKVIAHLSDTSGLKSPNITTVTHGKHHEIWAASLSGISKIKYEYVHGQIKTTIQNLSLKDGLSSTSIHQLLYRHDTLFAATDKGISSIPDSIPIPEIPIIITRIRINQKDTLLLNNFELRYYENIISIDFAGIELNGYFDHAQFSEDQGLSWIDLGENNFRKQFKSGEHSIWLRAVDVNNHASKGISKLQFNIDKPFYENIWFWLGIASVLFAIGIYINNILARRKHQKDIKELMNQQALDELEIQSLKAQMNPHFVFNCLNSIKGFIYDEDFEMADQYLDKFAQLLRSTLEFSTKPSISLHAELEYIENYLSLEQLRFANKFTYEIHIAQNIDPLTISIPSMLLQPYIENSIKHGVCNLDDGIGIIKVNVYLDSDKMQIDIIDNGVGRAFAENLKKNRNPTHNSKGTLVTQRRIELYHIELTIHDNKDEHGNPSGTSIHLSIPIPLY